MCVQTVAHWPSHTHDNIITVIGFMRVLCAATTTTVYTLRKMSFFPNDVHILHIYAMCARGGNDKKA